MAIAVKCPICGAISVKPKKPRFYFKCCGISHTLEGNLVSVGYEKEAKKEEKGGDLSKNGRKQPENPSKTYDIT